MTFWDQAIAGENSPSVQQPDRSWETPGHIIF